MSATEGTSTPSRVVGILGGMGPRATVDFYDKLVANTPARTDQEHVRVVIWGDPSVPSRQEAILGNGTDPTPWLRQGIQRLVTAGAQILVVPCNTVHYFLPGLMPDGVEFLSILDATVAAARRRSVTHVGLLATNAALASDLFQNALKAAEIDAVLPSSDDQAKLTEMINQVKDGTADGSTHGRLMDVLEGLHKRGVRVAIAGCTELSALVGAHHKENGYDIIDPALELALIAIQRAFAPVR